MKKRTLFSVFSAAALLIMALLPLYASSKAVADNTSPCHEQRGDDKTFPSQKAQPVHQHDCCQQGFFCHCCVSFMLAPASHQFNLGKVALKWEGKFAASLRFALLELDDPPPRIFLI